MPELVSARVSSGFTKSSEMSIVPRLIVSVEGEPGAGTSSFVYGAPEPVYVLRFERTSEEALRKATEIGRDISIKDFVLDVSDQYVDTVYTDIKSKEAEEAQKQMKTAASELWDELCSTVAGLVREMQESGQRGTIGFEKWSDCFNTLVLARCGRLNQVPQIMYNKFYAEMKNLLRPIEAASGINAVLLYRLKHSYKKVQEMTTNGPKVTNIRLDKMERSGFDDIEYIAHSMVRVYRGGSLTDPSHVEGEEVMEDGSYWMQILKGNGKGAVIGKTLNIDSEEPLGPLSGFDTLAREIYGDRWDAR